MTQAAPVGASPEHLTSGRRGADPHGGTRMNTSYGNGFTVWMTGAGVKRAFSYGATDPFGYQAVENIATIYDLHATILHLLGLDHERLSYYHNGIERRLTDVHGQVITEVLV